MIPEHQYVGGQPDSLGARGQVAQCRERIPITCPAAVRVRVRAAQCARCRSGGGSRAGPRSSATWATSSIEASFSQSALIRGSLITTGVADRQLRGVGAHPCIYPPASTGIDCPVMVRLSSLARNNARLATSSGEEISCNATPLRDFRALRSQRQPLVRRRCAAPICGTARCRWRRARCNCSGCRTGPTSSATVLVNARSDAFAVT